MRSIAVLVAILVVTYGQIPGGAVTRRADDPRFTEIAWEAVQDEAINGADRTNFFVPVKVISAKVQVVAGRLTTLTVVFGESNCASKKVQANQLSAANCQFKNGGSRELYTIKLYERSWENFKQFTISKTRDLPVTEEI